MAGKPSVVTEDNIELAKMMLMVGIAKFAIKAELRRKKGMSARSMETILSRAKEILVKSSGRSKRAHVNRAQQTYEGIIADPRTSTASRIRAQDSLCKLFGLHTHTIIHTGTGEGGAIKTENKTTVSGDLKTAPTEDLHAAREALMRLRSSASRGTPN